MEHRGRRHHLYALILVGAFVFAACAGTPRALKTQTYEDLVRVRIERSRAQPTFLLRHNPTDCACSPFEIFVGDVPVEGAPLTPAWHRVELTGLDDTDPIIASIREHLAFVDVSGRPDRRRFVMEGRLETRFGRCARGAALLSFVPGALLESLP